MVSLEYRYGKQLIALPLLLRSMIACEWLEGSSILLFWLSSAFNLRATRFASDMSYGAYLFHGFFISACGSMIWGNKSLMTLPLAQRTLAMFAFVFIGAYLTASIVHRLVESPRIRLGKDIIRRAAPAVPNPATPQRPGRDETRSKPKPFISLKSTL
jgi:peptidoglycan/LPS O-acetylase OafA/YrhL